MRVGRARGGVGGPAAVLVRYGIGNGSVGILDIADVTNKIGIKRRHVKIQHGLFRRYLGIAQPALTLIALGTVGRHAMEVRPLTPENDALDLVEQGVRGGEASAGFHGAVHDPPAQSFQTGCSGISSQLYIPEAVIGESRLVRLYTLAPQDINISRLGASDVFAIDHPVRIDQLAEAPFHVTSPRTSPS